MSATEPVLADMIDLAGVIIRSVFRGIREWLVVRHPNGHARWAKT